MSNGKQSSCPTAGDAAVKARRILIRERGLTPAEEWQRQVCRHGRAHASCWDFLKQVIRRLWKRSLERPSGDGKPWLPLGFLLSLFLVFSVLRP